MQRQNGVVVDRAGVAILDTREMEWEQPRSDLAERLRTVRGARKILHRDEQGAPMVWLNTMPAGFTVPDLPYRHYHSTVNEFAYFLSGESQVFEYESAEQQNGQFVIKRAGYFMHRWPGSIQGLEPGPTTPIGAHMLLWRTGPGTEMGEETFESETFHVPYAPGWKPDPDPRDLSVPQPSDGTIISRPDFSLLDTRAMEWRPVPEWQGLPGLEDVRRKVLDRDPDGAPSVVVDHIPAGFTLPEPYRHYHRTVEEFAFVLDGELPLWEYESAEQREGTLVVCKPGYFIHRRPGSIHGLEPTRTTPVGALVIAWRTGSGTMIGDERFAAETVEVP